MRHAGGPGLPNRRLNVAASLCGVAVFLQRLCDLCVGGFLVAVDAAVIPAMDHLRRVTDPPSHLSDGYPRVQPPCDARVPHVVGAAGQWRVDALGRECVLPPQCEGRYRSGYAASDDGRRLDRAHPHAHGTAPFPCLGRMFSGRASVPGRRWSGGGRSGVRAAGPGGRRGSTWR